MRQQSEVGQLAPQARASSAPANQQGADEHVSDVRYRGPRTQVSSTPLVSVIIPSYNHGRFIERAVESVLTQSHQNFELIIIDDGSSDGSVGLLRQRYGSDPRVKVRSRENRGAHATINEGISLAVGEFITILNSDDTYEPTRLERLVALARDHGGHPFFAISGLRVVDEEGEPAVNSAPLSYYSSTLDKFEGQPDLAAFWVGNLAMTTSNFFFSKQVFDEIGPFSSLRYTHDWDWALRASTRFGVIRTDEVLLQYRVHGTNTISEGKLWKHVSENAYVFSSAMQRGGLLGLAEASGRSPVDVFRALLSNESFGPLPTLFLMALGASPERLAELLAAGTLEEWMPQLLGSSQRDIDLMLSLQHLRTRLQPSSKPAAALKKKPVTKRALAAIKKAGKRLRKRLEQGPA